MFEVMDLGWLDAFGGVKNLRSVLPSGYENLIVIFEEFC